MVTADIVGLYPGIPHHAGLEHLRRALDDQVKKRFSINDLIKKAEFVLKINCFELWTYNIEGLLS